jgi:hypothetical protein
MSKKDFTAENVGFEPIILNKEQLGLQGPSLNIMPIKLYLKEDGAKDNGRSIALLSIDANNRGYVSQISLKMLNEGLADIGYELKKIN